MTDLVIEGLRASAGGHEVLTGVDLVVGSGEVHAVMGPNGSGKSTLAHVIAGHHGCQVISGSVRIDGTELLGLPAWQRAEAGLFLAMQYPTEVPGVSLVDMLTASLRTNADPDVVMARMVAEARRIGLEEELLSRPLNVDLSGGERKRNETLQMALLAPSFAVIDELDSGLDVDALRLVSRRISDANAGDGMGVLAITHYSRLFEHLRPHSVHIFAGGRIRESGGPELADLLEAEGYERWVEVRPARAMAPTVFDDPFGDPFADQLI